VLLFRYRWTLQGGGGGGIGWHGERGGGIRGHRNNDCGRRIGRILAGRPGSRHGDGSKGCRCKYHVRGSGGDGRRGRRGGRTHRRRCDRGMGQWVPGGFVVVAVVVVAAVIIIIILGSFFVFLLFRSLGGLFGILGRFVLRRRSLSLHPVSVPAANPRSTGRGLHDGRVLTEEAPAVHKTQIAAADVVADVVAVAVVIVVAADVVVVVVVVIVAVIVVVVVAGPDPWEVSKKQEGDPCGGSDVHCGSHSKAVL